MFRIFVPNFAPNLPRSFRGRFRVLRETNRHHSKVAITSPPCVLNTKSPGKSVEYLHKFSGVGENQRGRWEGDGKERQFSTFSDIFRLSATLRPFMTIVLPSPFAVPFGFRRWRAGKVKCWEVYNREFPEGLEILKSDSLPATGQKCLGPRIICMF